MIMRPMRHEIADDMARELNRANKLYPDFPKDVVRGVAIVAEECGEAIRAANDYDVNPNDETRRDVHDELIQTMAMCVRVLQSCLYEVDNG